MPTSWSGDVDSGLSRSNIIIFDFFASLGIVSILLVLIPVWFSRRIRRSATWFGVLLSWLVYSVSCTLLFGYQINSKPPPLGLCLFQAVLIYAGPASCGTATTCLAIDVCFTTTSNSQVGVKGGFQFFLKVSRVKLQGKKIGPKSQKLLISAPWVLGLVLAAETILVVNDFTVVALDPNHFYCHLEIAVPAMTNAIIVLLCALIIVPIEVYTGIILYRNWITFQHMNGGHARIALSTLIRLTLFTLGVILGIGLSLFTATNMGNYVPLWNFILMMMPTFSALCFGTQRDIMRTWLFWKRPKCRVFYDEDSDTDDQ